MSELQKTGTVPMLARARADGRKLVMLTCYDASFARVLDDNGCDLILVGDSLGMVVQGHASTLPVRVEDIAYHTAAVARGARRALKIADFPFGSDGSPQEAHAAAVRFIQAGASMVKLEGAGHKLETIRYLVEREIPVCSHLGLTPQSVHRFGGFKVQGREDAAAARLCEEALAVADAGAALLVLEGVPAPLATRITAASPIPTIGIGPGRRAQLRMSGIVLLHDLDGLRAQVRGWKRQGLRVGFVPTMGNLHEGHFSLVRLAREHADRVVASVFVNPTQFGPNEDFSRYPRTPGQDAAGLQAAGCDALWMPSVDAMYPYGAGNAVRIHVPGITDTLDGAHRPGHFDGVATVVARLFNQVQPEVAVFGRKDYQQLAVIRYLARDLAFPLEIVARREDDGLAMSSRNQYLSAEERAIAPAIHRTLLAMRDAIRAGTPRHQVEADAEAALRAAGFAADYAVVRCPDFSTPDADGAGAERVALVAARLGRTRLIDNLEFDAG